MSIRMIFNFSCNHSGQRIKRHLTQRRKVAKTPRTSKAKNYRFISKTFGSFYWFSLRLRVFASKFLTQDFMAVELVINSAE